MSQTKPNLTSYEPAKRAAYLDKSEGITSTSSKQPSSSKSNTRSEHQMMYQHFQYILLKQYIVISISALLELSGSWIHQKWLSKEP